MKLLANIAYHHHPNRVENLTKVIEAIKSYPLQSDIFVDTNDPQAAQELAYLPVTFHAHTGMGHPWELTSKHRNRIAEVYQHFDWVAYFEDDMMLPKEGFVNFTQQFDAMFEDNLYPSFTRIETYPDKEGEFSPDITFNLTPNMWREWNGKTYASLPYYINYHAFWMFSTKRLAEVLSRNPQALQMIPNNGLYRESLASMPIWSLGFAPMLEMDKNGELADHCKVYHLTNNYSNQSRDIKEIFKR